MSDRAAMIRAANLIAEGARMLAEALATERAPGAKREKREPRKRVYSYKPKNEPTPETLRAVRIACAKRGIPL